MSSFSGAVISMAIFYILFAFTHELILRCKRGNKIMMEVSSVLIITGEVGDEKKIISEKSHINQKKH